ncbi:MAG TPA: glycosyltransferase [Saprospiraceae bacterium]|nr:glycosyltransferase [Saprospiraceae bacterium]MCC6687817.1 glycosyltransferase [Saprospiraceae bacterium]HMV22920.1 glycosyltransferase [Saprospiraceae bacterium]HMX84513.1 glycosyltransferase [Saprospiraceae bacterium]HMZ73157.1 glycosyltransferase [Saprospiraceae bacterium]
MLVGSIFIFVVFLSYSVLLFRITTAWDSSGRANSLHFGLENLPGVSIIIPARNEEDNIGHTLHSVLSQDFATSLVEILIIDDHSTDSTTHIASGFGSKIRILQLADMMPDKGGKKMALQYGIANSKRELIVTLDADCHPVSDNWLQTMVSQINDVHTNATTGPVRYESDGSIWQNFVALDNAGMMVVTAAGYRRGWFQMANGANMCFRKEIFNKVNGYAGNVQLASGDDMFLFEKIEARFPGTIRFIHTEQAIVSTQPPTDLKQWLRQRIRWGTKNRYLKNTKLKLLLGFVFLINLLLMFIPVLIIFSTDPFLWVLLSVSVCLKIGSDYRLLKRGAVFLKQNSALKYYPVSAILYPLLLSISGVLSMFKSRYEWKDRQVR